MPIYDYACANCGKVTEVIHRIHDGGPKFCPECGAAGTMRKGITTSVVHFKGSGWAKKDRSTPAPAAKVPATKAAGESGGAAGASSKGETPPAPTTTAATTSSEGGD